jgi:hypothetical protein
VAYFPSLKAERFNVGGMLSPGGAVPASSVGGGVSRPQAQSDAGGRFAALRGFFGANQEAANEKVGTLTAPIEAKANEAVSLTNEASRLTEEQGGVGKASEATVARDDAKQMLGALGSQGGIAGLLGEGDASYTEGQRSADAALFGRAPGLGDFKDKWDGVLGALSPTYSVPAPLAPPVAVPIPESKPETYEEEQIRRAKELREQQEAARRRQRQGG